MKRRILIVALFLAVVLLVTPVQALATGTTPYSINPSEFSEDAKSVEPKLRYSNISTILTTITYSGSTATCAVDVVGLNGTTKISVTMSLQRLESNGTYTTIKSWSTETVNSDAFYLSKTYTVVRGASYRTNAVVSVTRNGTTETVTSRSNTVKCP